MRFQKSFFTFFSITKGAKALKRQMSDKENPTAPLKECHYKPNTRIRVRKEPKDLSGQYQKRSRETGQRNDIQFTMNQIETITQNLTGKQCNNALKNWDWAEWSFERKSMNKFPKLDLTDHPCDDEWGNDGVQFKMD